MSGSGTSDSTSGRGKKASGKRAISEARQYSQLHYSEDFTREPTILDTMYNIKSFSLDFVASRMYDIKDAFAVEQTELECDIKRLNETLDGEVNFGSGCDLSFDNDSNNSNLVSSMANISLTKSSSAATVTTTNPSPNPVHIDRLEMCSVCSQRKPSQTISTISGGGNKIRGGSGSIAVFVCAACQIARTSRDAKLGGHNNNNTMSHSRSVPANVTSSAAAPKRAVSPAAAQINRHNNNDDSPDAAQKPSSRGSGGGSSRFRSRLDSARHEHHFLDEF